LTPTLRRATARDVPAITALVHAAYVGTVDLLGREPMPMTVDYAEAVATHEVWVLDEGDRLTGVLELIAKPDAMWIENVAVAPDRQGHGLGRWLLSFAEERARESGRDAMGLLTNERYTGNITMYERYGYRETHREPYRGSDVVTFRKELPTRHGSAIRLADDPGAEPA
jgi:GNAT superfamily N-acetyltransferase